MRPLVVRGECKQKVCLTVKLQIRNEISRAVLAVKVPEPGISLDNEETHSKQQHCV